MTVLFSMCLLIALFKESQAGGKSNVVSDYKMWKSWTFPKWKGDKYFEESSKNRWVEVENNKVIHEFTLVAKASAQVVLQRIDKSNYFIKLLPGMAWHGKELNDITGIVERGDWECKLLCFHFIERILNTLMRMVFWHVSFKIVKRLLEKGNFYASIDRAGTLSLNK